MSGYAADLRAEWRFLEQQWEQTRSGWRDMQGRGFEREMWEELTALVPALLQAMERLEDEIRHC